jgi:organic hydroperoxide reductase OsmC/OhrA
MCYNSALRGTASSQGVTVAESPDVQTRIHTLLAAKAQLEAQVHELTVEVECLRQYTRPVITATAGPGMLLNTAAPWTS